MQKFWDQLEKELGRYASDIVTRLRPGADEVALKQTEQALGIRFPEELRELYRRHNGSEGAIFDVWKFLSLEELTRDWMEMKKKADPSFFLSSDHLFMPSSARWVWNQYWLPFMRAEGAGRLYVNLHPTSQHGSILLYHDASLLPASTVAPSLSAFLEMLAEQVAIGYYVYDPLQGVLCSHRTTLSEEEQIAEPSEENQPETPVGPVIYPGILSLPYQEDQAHSIGQFEGSILESWQQIQASITELAPPIARKLRRGATDTCLLRAEMVLNLDFPEDMKVLYSTCDGMQPRIGGLIDLWYWYPLELLVRRWEEMQEESAHNPLQLLSDPYLACADPRIQAVRWHPRWIPLMEYDDKGMYCLDLAPTEQGQEGQIILCFGFHYEHFYLVERGVPPVMVVAPDLRTFLAMLARNLKMGNYTFDPEIGVLWSQEGRAFVEKDPHIIEAVRGGRILWG